MKKTSSGAHVAAVVLAAGFAIAPASSVSAQSLAAPDAAPRAGSPSVLTLAEAVARGLEHNLAAVLSRHEAEAAVGAAKVARAALLPTVSAQGSAAREKIDLEAYGLPVAPGESPLIGPFDVVDLRLAAELPILDLRARAAARSAGSTAEAARLNAEDARDAVVLAVSTLYLKATAADSRIVAARAQVATARALFEQAQDMKAAGLVAGVEVLRAKVQLAGEEQRLIVAENDAATGRLALAQTIGLPLDQAFTLESLGAEARPLDITVDEALVRATALRSDLAAARASVAAAEYALTAARDTVLPTLVAHADAGRVGPDTPGLETTYSAMAAIRVPVYAGGEIHGRKVEAAARVAQAKARLEDLQSRVEYQVRAALLDVRAADERVRVAHEAAGVADAQLAQARDRFAAGVASGVEVVQAQEQTATAHENAIASLLADSEARVALARAVGAAAENLADFLGGRL
jgi:outer membrane protein TolC